MLYTEDFTMRHYVGFSQIGSHISCRHLESRFAKILLSHSSALQDWYASMDFLNIVLKNHSNSQLG